MENEDTSKKKYGLPSTWIDRIFLRLAEIYKEKWLYKKDSNEVSLLKTIWATSLSDLNHHEIKRALEQCRINPHLIPDHIKFHQYAKGYDINPIAKTNNEKNEMSESAKQILKTIRNNLHIKIYKDIGDDAATTSKK